MSFCHSLANGFPGFIRSQVTVSATFSVCGQDELLLMHQFKAAFISAFIVGVSLHYHKIVENEYYGYPQEWFPSVSATIGDRYPERSVFMLFIAITSGNKFSMLGDSTFANERQVLVSCSSAYGTSLLHDLEQHSPNLLL